MVARGLFFAAACAMMSGIGLAETLADGKCFPCPGAANTNDVILEARAISHYSDSMQKAGIALRAWKLKRTRAQQFQERQEKSLEEQIKKRESIKERSGHDVDAIKTSKKEMLVQHMCTLVFGAFLNKDEEDKTKLVKLCMGREDLALTAKSQSLRGRRQEPTDEEEAVSASPKVQEMKAEYEVLQAKVTEARDAYWSDTEKWAKDREDLGADEDELGSEAADFSEDKSTAKADAWEEVKADWCPAFNSGEDTVVPYAKENCGQDAPIQ